MKTVIFDFGNVIFKWDPFRALNGIFATRQEMDATLKRIGFFDWNLEQDRGRSWAEGVAIAARDMPEHAQIFAAYADNLAAAHDQLIPGTSELIHRLYGNGVTLIGLTNASIRTVEILRELTPVLALMPEIIISAEVKLVKPDPEIFQLCLKHANIAAAEALFVDDSLPNCQTARSLGIQTHHFSNAASLETELNDLKLL